MVDIIPTIAEWLGNIGRVELQFPDVNAEFPLITVCEIVNQSDTVLNRQERVSLVSVQVDVWDNGKTPEKVSDMSAQISTVMLSKGFRRVFGQFMPDGDLQRRCMRFTAKIDEINSRVYNP